MTLSIAWVRTVKETQELVVATDSRLRFGRAWDCCPKIFTLARQDSVLCFAGDTAYAYPIMIQIKNAIDMYPKLASRAMDLSDARGHFLRIINKMQLYMHDFPRSENIDTPETFFILAGYSWQEEKFVIWIIKYDKRRKEFIHETPPTIMKNTIAITGDDVKEVRQAIHDRMVKHGKQKGDGFDMEPFEVLRDKIRSNINVAIGGPPQVVKVYKHMNIMPYGVLWPDKESKQITFLGRPILNYELVPYPIIDPDSLEVSTMKIDNPEFERTFDDGRSK